MIAPGIVERFGLIDQHQRSPDGYAIFIAGNLSNNNPTVFFELVADVKPPGRNVTPQESVKITKAGATNHLLLTMSELGNLDFAQLQQMIEEQLRIPG
jgi:hypothetical protein